MVPRAKYGVGSAVVTPSLQELVIAGIAEYGFLQGLLRASAFLPQDPLSASEPNVPHASASGLGPRCRLWLGSDGGARGKADGYRSFRKLTDLTVYRRPGLGDSGLRLAWYAPDLPDEGLVTAPKHYRFPIPKGMYYFAADPGLVISVSMVMAISSPITPGLFVIPKSVRLTLVVAEAPM